MKKILVLSVAASLVVSANVAHAITAITYPFEYDFVNSSDPRFSGALFLDVSSSSSGTLLDIGPSSFIDTPDYNFTFAQLTTGVPVVHGTFSWNASAITSMDITGNYSFFTGEALVGENFEITQGGISETPFSFADPNASGMWLSPNVVAGVPDATSTGLMLGIVGGAMGFVRRRLVRKS